MKKLKWLLSIALLIAAIPASCETTADSIKSTVRLRTITEDAEFVTTGYGSAFGIDLNAYGLSSRRYMLSAAHVVMRDDGLGLKQGEFRVEVGGELKNWVKCRVVSIDKRNDLCLLECDADLPALAQFGDGKEALGTELLVVGCPAGVPVKVSRGTLTTRKPNVDGRLWQAAASFYHGNSGGPVFNAQTGGLMGVAVAGIPGPDGGMNRNIALFAPVDVVRKFVKKAVSKMQGSAARG